MGLQSKRLPKPRRVGRPKGSYRKYKLWLRVLVPKPPKCVCGSNDYRFKHTGGVLWAICNKCGYKRYYLPGRGAWGPRPIPPKGS